MIDPAKTREDRMAALPGILRFYTRWYPPLWLQGVTAPLRYGEWGALAGHVRFIERAARKLARSSFHGMAIYQAKMERKQGFLFRCVDVVMELFAMAATCAHARRLEQDRAPNAAEARELADLFCRLSRRKVRRLFRDLWRNDDDAKGRVAASVMSGRHTWLEQGVLDMGLDAEAFRPRRLTERTERERAAEGA
jgi:hypothetical protein